MKPIAKTILATALSLLLVQAFAIAETENKENEQPAEALLSTFTVGADRNMCCPISLGSVMRK